MNHTRDALGRFQCDSKIKGFGAVLFLLACFCTTIRAQWITQNIQLSPGFNAVYLQVTPSDPACDSIFTQIPQVRSVWKYNRYTQTATFITNAAQSVSGQDHWLTWFPSGGTKGFLSTLAQLRGGESYLIQLSSNSAPMTIHLKGYPAVPRSDWIPNDVVLAGFPIVETEKVTLSQFLSDSPQVSTTPGQNSGVFSINSATALETQIRNPALTTLIPGRAYWVYLNGHTDNPYPFQVSAPGQNGSVQFVQDNPFSSLTLNNSVSTSSQTLHIRTIESEPAPTGRPSRGGTVPVAALVPDSDGSYTIRRLADGIDITLAPGEKKDLKLGLILRQLIPVSDTNSTYQALLEVTEKLHGYRQLLPVVAEVPGSKLFGRIGGLMGSAGTIASQVTSPEVAAVALNAGLWVGTLTLNAVNNPGFSVTNNPDATQFPVIAATTLNTRVMIHVDSNGVSRLVQQVIFANVSDGTNQTTRMYSSLSAVPAGATLKSRVSAPSWPVHPPVELPGSFGGTVTGSVTETYNDKVNPFVHRYHPDHNNLAEDFETVLPAGVESFDITRNIGFYFGNTLQTGSQTYAPAVPALKFTAAKGEFLSTTGFSTTPALSVQFWVKLMNLQQNGATLALMTNTATGAQIKISFQANTGIPALTVQNGSGIVGQVLATNSLPVGTWVNVVSTYDGISSGFIFINGTEAGRNYLPALSSGAWDAIWLGNSASSGTSSFSGEIHDVVVRNGSLPNQIVPQVMVVPQLLNPESIVLDLQGNAGSLSVVNRGSASVTISPTSGELLDLSSSPSVPLWTYGTVSGTYQETILGLRRQAITLQGTFQLTRVSQDSNLY